MLPLLPPTVCSSEHPTNSDVKQRVKEKNRTVHSLQNILSNDLTVRRPSHRLFRIPSQSEVVHKCVEPHVNLELLNKHMSTVSMNAWRGSPTPRSGFDGELVQASFLAHVMPKILLLKNQCCQDQTPSCRDQTPSCQWQLLTWPSIVWIHQLPNVGILC